MSTSEQGISAAEASAVTKPSVVAGLGYPAGRDEVSPQPTGWQKDVSRETT
ncbi:MAG: hypothetical protein F2854_00645 [Actinobacteria bacterium]|nr:hypothetical protein [Actinomycetota bacterium]